MSKKTGINHSYVVLVVLGFVAGVISIALLAKTYPLFSTKALFFCQQFISNTLFELPRSLPGVLTIAVWIILSLGLVSLFFQLVKTYALIWKINPKKISLTPNLRKTANFLGLENNILLIEEEDLYSFCFGFLNPKIIITSGIVSRLSHMELEAVLLHEQAHLKNKDPLKLLIGKAVSSMFFFLPVFGELYRNMEASNELIADSWAAQVQKESRFLRSALRKIISQPQVTFAMVPAISHPDHIEIRVRQLANTEIKYKLTLSYGSIVGSAIFIIVSLFVLQTPVNAFQAEDSGEPSYFVCSVDMPVSSSKYKAPSYK